MRNKNISLLIIIFCIIFVFQGCSKENLKQNDETNTNPTITPENNEDEVTEPKTYTWDEATVYEAENGTLLGGARVETENNINYVDSLKNDGDGVKISINIETSGFYDINVFCKSLEGQYKANYVLINDENVGSIVTESNEYTDCIISRTYLEAGEHTVTVSKNWGWIMIDSVKVKPSDELDQARFDVNPELVNPNASDNTQRLMNYLCDLYGEYILSGQYCDDGMHGTENRIIYETTGEYPAILGLDMMNYTPYRVEMGTSSDAVEKAIEYWQNGGIVTFCWHWNAPGEYITGTWYSGFYTDHTNLDLGKIMNGQDPEGYDTLMADIDAVAVQLQRLEDADVPVLWRPLHEASGGWFWWGASGAEPYIELYQLMYDRLTNEHGLDNLIWVWNGQNPDWYPGDEYVDIIGEDIYPGEKVYTPQTAKYMELLEYTKENKMIILSENGCLFDPDLALRDGSMWGSFCTWGGDFITSGQYTEEYMLKKVYTHEKVITRDELADIVNYPLD